VHGQQSGDQPPAGFDHPAGGRPELTEPAAEKRPDLLNRLTAAGQVGTRHLTVEVELANFVRVRRPRRPNPKSSRQRRHVPGKRISNQRQLRHNNRSRESRPPPTAEASGQPKPVNLHIHLEKNR
jgi:hypothetical protein